MKVIMVCILYFSFLLLFRW